MKVEGKKQISARFCEISIKNTVQAWSWRKCTTCFERSAFILLEQTINDHQDASQICEGYMLIYIHKSTTVVHVREWFPYMEIFLDHHRMNLYIIQSHKSFSSPTVKHSCTFTLLCHWQVKLFFNLYEYLLYVYMLDVHEIMFAFFLIYPWRI